MIWLLSLAHAAEFEVHAHGALGDAPVRSAGLGVAVARPFRPSLSVEGLLQGGFDAADGPVLQLRPELRWSPLNADLPVHPSLIAGYGMRLGGPALPEGALGVGLELPYDLRLQGRYLLVGTEVHSFQLSFGWVRRPPEPEAEPEPVLVEVEPEPVTESEPEPFQIRVSPEGTQVWLPHPICQWMDIEAATPLLEDLPEGTPLRFRAPGHLPVTAEAAPEMVVELDEAPIQGSLLVIAEPSDRVIVNDSEVQPDADGVVVLTVGEELLRVEVIGGGRATVWDPVGVSDGEAVWLRADEPGPLHVTFPVDSSVLGRAGRQAITEIAGNAADWSFQVSGSFSPEGNLEHNKELAEGRAQAAAQALVDAGVSADRIEVLPPPDSVDEQEDWAQLRGAWVVPVPGGSP